MPISTKNIHDYINACQSNTNNSLENTQLTGAICALNKGAVYSVPTLNDLPSASENEGRFVFVEDVGGYRFSDGLEWTNDYGSTAITAIYGRGNNLYGQIGDGTNFCRSSPVQEVSSSSDWSQVSGGNYHSLALKTDGTLWGWGRVVQIGSGETFGDKSSPVQEFTSSTDWCQVSAGGIHSLALKTSGTLWGWGDNGFAQIGDNTTNDRCSPVQEVSSSSDWCQVSGAGVFSLALKTSGTLWAWGCNIQGRLGDGTTISRSSPVQEVSSSTDWCQVSGGCLHSLALKTSGTLWGWGNNLNRNIGDGTIICRSSPVQEVSSSSNWCQVSGGDRHSLALKTSGTLWGWGTNSVGPVGDGTTISKNSPVQEVSSSTDWCQVSAGGFHSLALKKTGTTWTWGSNFFGQVGDGSTIFRSSPVQEVSLSSNWYQVSGGNTHSLALKVEKGFL